MNNKIMDWFNGFFWDLYADSYDTVTQHYKPYLVLKKEIISFVAAKKSKGNIFDAGCGTGTLSIKLHELGYNMTSVDISNAMLKIFKSKLRKTHKNLSIYNADLNKPLKAKRRSFDFVINVHSLFMLDDIIKSLDALCDLVKPGGYIIIAHHKPISVFRLVIASLKEDGFIYTIRSLARLFKAGVLNIILGFMHKKYYKSVPLEEITKRLKQNNFSKIVVKTLYRGYDELIIFKKKIK